ncbi:MAG: hypothetical protein HYY92_00470 [Parcubacteria group bacterium]|nr:hypothetical protein [Parcubacteria group bacterium]
MKGKNTLFLVLFTLVLGLFALGACSTSDAWRTRLSSGPVTYEQVDVEQMQKETGIGEVILSFAFGIPKTAEEKQIYESLASDIAAAKTFYEARRVHFLAPGESEVGKAAFQKMFSFAVTSEEWDEVYKSAPSGSETEKIAQMKRDTIRNTSLGNRLAAAITFSEVENVYHLTTTGSVMREAALQKMLSLATTFTMAQKVYTFAPRADKIEKAALEKMFTFATTLAEVRFIFQFASLGTELKKATVRRLAEFYKKEQKK